MRSSSWPRLAFTYTVTENGVVVCAGEADIHDFNDLNGFNPFFVSDRLRYERQILAAWFRKNRAQGDRRAEPGLIVPRSSKNALAGRYDDAMGRWPPRRRD